MTVYRTACIPSLMFIATKLVSIPASRTLPRKVVRRKGRDRALLAVLLACGLRRHEAVSLEMRQIQQREEHWAIFDPAW